MKEITINIARDFSKYPRGRYRTDGEFSGERFRDDLLVPALKEYDRITLELDETLGYGSSFLSETFQFLSDKTDKYIDDIKEQLTLVTECETLKCTVENHLNSQVKEKIKIREIQVKEKIKIRKIYEVWHTDLNDGSAGHKTVGFFLNEEAAITVSIRKEYCVQGYLAQSAAVTSYPVYETLSDFDSGNIQSMRKRALAKLTEEEKKVLQLFD